MTQSPAHRTHQLGGQHLAGQGTTNAGPWLVPELTVTHCWPVHAEHWGELQSSEKASRDAVPSSLLARTQQWLALNGNNGSGSSVTSATASRPVMPKLIGATEQCACAPGSQVH